jgi:hypothetical protein
MRKHGSVASTTFALLLVASGGSPAQNGGMQTIPAAYNPGRAPVQIVAGWLANASSPDEAPSRHPLILQISDLVPFPPGASAIAVMHPTDGLKLVHLAFDHKIGTYCAIGSPRWDVETTDGSVYAFGCATGVRQIDLPAPGWERITFSCSDAGVLKGVAGSCPLGSGQPVKLLQVVQDEPGSTTLDNLDVNWAVMTGPGGQ